MKRFEPFSYPEITELTFELVDKLTQESSRGALLIATYHVDEYLRKLLLSKMPSNLSQTKIDSVFSYRGPFNSFSQKIERGYEYGLFSKKLYDNMNYLRNIRNDAAHSKTAISIDDLKATIKSVYDFGPQFSWFFEQEGIRLMLSFKLPEVIKFIRESELSPEDQREVYFKIIEDKEFITKVEKQAPFWELAIGISFICGLILHFKETTNIKTEKENDWKKLLKVKD